MQCFRIIIGFLVFSFCHLSKAATNTPDDSMMAFLKAEARRLDDSFLQGITNRQQWESKRKHLQQEYLDMLGLWPLPEKTPLKAKVTGTIERDEGFRVENVHFQSRPGLYVTGNLYLPSRTNAAKLPTVLYVCGHSGRGRDGNKVAFQHHGMWFATHGYVCLIIDTLQLGEIAAIHHGTYRYNRWWWQAAGYSPAGVECWNGIRAIDYLATRPEVDTNRIAVTGISGGGAATFWIAAADERVKVAVPVSGMSDLEDYVGAKVVNGHCDCMFLINTYRWPWTHIAALIAPRPMLFENSGHDTIFPMDGNDRIRARLERLYGFYTNRTDRLFDIGVTPGGHEDNPELRLMAYRWINRHLKGDNSPVTEPELPKIDGMQLRAFPKELPADEMNTRIDEVFVPPARNDLPDNQAQFDQWRKGRLEDLQRIVFGDLSRLPVERSLKIPVRGAEDGTVLTEGEIEIAWRFHPPKNQRPDAAKWLLVLSDDDSLESIPAWAASTVGSDAVFSIAPRGAGPLKFDDPAPYYVARSLALLGRTLESGRVADVLSMARSVLAGNPGRWNIIGRGRSGVVAAYAALFEQRLEKVAVIDPPASHREGPIFLNILRVLDIPEALGMLAPRPLTVVSADPQRFQKTEELYRTTGGLLMIQRGAREEAFKGHTGSVMSVCFSPQGGVLASGCRDTTVRLWKLTGTESARVLSGHTSDVYSVVFNPDGKWLATGSGDKTIRIWDWKKESPVQTIQAHNDVIRALSFSPDGKLLASTGGDLTVKVWDCENWQLKRSATNHTARVKGVAFSPKGDVLATAGDDRNIIIWNTSDLSVRQKWQAHAGPIETVAFSPTGEVLASSSEDGTICVWNSDNWKRRHILEGHTGEVDSIAFSPDGKLLASGSKDQTLKIWNTASGRLSGSRQAHDDRVESLAFAPDGDTIATGSGSKDASIKIWKVKELLP